MGLQVLALKLLLIQELAKLSSQGLEAHLVLTNQYTPPLHQCAAAGTKNYAQAAAGWGLGSGCPNQKAVVVAKIDRNGVPITGFLGRSVGSKVEVFIVWVPFFIK
jgi:hypothetical protein